MNDVLLVGGFVETIELCELCGLRITGIIDKALTGSLCGYPILGSDADIEEIYAAYARTPVIIAPDMPSVRAGLFMLYKRVGFAISSLISPKAFISPSARLGEGCIIQSMCHVSSNAVLGMGVKMNTLANVMHDCNICDCVTIAPNAVILGGVNIGEQAYIGANSTILPTRVIGKRAVVGAGAVVTKDVLRDTVVAGVPARRMEKNQS